MNGISRIRMRFGLRWKRPPGWVIAEFFALIAALLFVAWYLYGQVMWMIEVYETSRLSAIVIREERQKVAHYESVVLACLRHDVVRVNGDWRVCEL